MGAFFTSWAIWEKLCFVLAVAIVGVVFIGIGKVIYNHWRLRKYTKIAAVKAQHRRAIEQRPSVRARKGREVPFGVRAIESGIEVDGVWISRSNTPIPSGSGSPAPSIMLESNSATHAQSPERASVAPSQQVLEVPQPVHGYSAASQGRDFTSSQASGPPQAQYTEAERLPRSSRVPDNVPRARPTYQPRRSSGLRFSNSHDNSSALAALEGRRMAPTPEAPESEDMFYGSRTLRNSGSHSSSNSSEEHYAPRRPRINRDSSDILFDPTYLPSGGPRTPHNETLNALANHRRSHAAEEGQLLPRIRLSGMNTSSSAEAPPEHRYTFEGTSSGEDSGNPFATPVGTPTTYTEEPPSFASFVNSSSSFPNDHVEPIDDVERAHPDSHGSGNALQQSDGNRQTRQSQIVRKVNSGFEILRPGSLSRPQEHAAWNEKTRIGSEHQPGQGTDGPRNKRHSKKLLRRRADSKESRFKEEV